jgi:predicted permease
MCPDLAESLKAGMRQGAYRSSRLRAVLLAVQTGLSVVLLVGAGLFTRSLNNVRSIGIGYETDNRILLHPEFDDALPHDTELRSRFPEAAARLRQIDGIRAVGYAYRVPIGGAMFRLILLPGRDSVPQLPGDYGPSISSVSPDFFKASGLPLKSGREFSDDDRADAPRVAIVGESMARLYWPGESGLGKCIMILKRDAPCTRVVGVASDAHRRSIVEATIAQFYVPLAQTPFAPHELIVQTQAGMGPATVHAAEQILRSVGLPITGLTARTFESILEPELRPWRLGATLFTALSALALVVAAIGVYSVVAYSSSQRTHEMGVRIALGAQRRDILDLVLGDGLRVVVIGIIAGVVTALLLGRFVASLMFGVVPADLAVLIGATCVLCVAASIACLIPGLRASAVDPSSALRTD